MDRINSGAEMRRLGKPSVIRQTCRSLYTSRSTSSRVYSLSPSSSVAYCLDRVKASCVLITTTKVSHRPPEPLETTSVYVNSAESRFAPTGMRARANPVSGSPFIAPDHLLGRRAGARHQYPTQGLAPARARSSPSENSRAMHPSSGLSARASNRSRSRCAHPAAV